MRYHRAAFSLVEVLAAIAILAVLIGLLLPAIQQARESSRRAECFNNQHQLGLAVLQFEEARRQFPGYNNLQAVGADGSPCPTGWLFSLLPWLEWDSVHEFHGKTGPDVSRGSVPNLEIPGLACPSDPWASAKGRGEIWNYTGSSYVANSGQVDVVTSRRLPPDWRANGVFMHLFPIDESGQPVANQVVSLDYLSTCDGTSRTLMLSENLDAGFWTDAAEASVGFVWEATLVDGRPAPTSIARINERAGERWRRALAQGAGPADLNLACISCGTGIPLPPPKPPLPPLPEIPWEPTDPAPDDGPMVDPRVAEAILDIHRSLALARPSSAHPGGVVATFADGHSEFIEDSIEYLVYCQLMAPRDERTTMAGTLDPVPVIYATSRSDGR